MPVPIATQQIPTDLVAKTTRELSVPAVTRLRAHRALLGISHGAARAPGAASSADGGSGMLTEPVPSSRSISKSVAEGRVLLVLQTSPTSLFHVPQFVEVRVMTLTYLGIKDEPPYSFPGASAGKCHRVAMLWPRSASLCASKELLHRCCSQTGKCSCPGGLSGAKPAFLASHRQAVMVLYTHSPCRLFYIERSHGLPGLLL